MVSILVQEEWQHNTSCVRAGDDLCTMPGTSEAPRKWAAEVYFLWRCLNILGEDKLPSEIRRESTAVNCENDLESSSNS